MDLTGLFGAEHALDGEPDRRGAIARQGLAELRARQDATSPDNELGIRRSKLVRRLEQYDVENLQPVRPGSRPPGAELDRLVDQVIDDLRAEGLIEHTHDTDTLKITDLGRVSFACEQWSSHLAHALQSTLEATVLWATTRPSYPGTPPATSAVRRQVGVAAEYAAFTHQRALFELLTKTGRRPKAGEPRDALDARKVLGIDEAQVPPIDEVLGAKIFTDLNRACSHVGRRHQPAKPPPRPHLQYRVGWLTAQLLHQWDQTQTSRLTWTGADLARVQQAMRNARQTATNHADAAMYAIDRDLAPHWDHLDDPFASWARV